MPNLEWQPQPRRAADDRRDGLEASDLDPDPIQQFLRWFNAAGAANVKTPEAMTLATATPDGAPSARMVLLKGVDARGFVFYTNYESRKSGELEANPRAALILYWEPLHRQVRIEGRVERATREESDAYFHSRPRDSQIGAAASSQSAVIPDRTVLEARAAELEAVYAGRELPLPEMWGGWRVVPESVEFWQGRTNRLHDRLRYTRAGDGWRIERLSP